MRMQAAAFVVVALLAACSPPAAQAPANQDSAAEAPAAPGAAPGSIQPGQYRTTVTILGMEIPGVKTAQINMRPTTTEDCVTSSDVAELTRGSMVDADEGETCTQNAMSAANGHIQGSATCQSEGGARTMTMNGSYTQTHVDLDVTATGSMPGGQGQMSQHIRVVTDRIGECTSGTN